MFAKWIMRYKEDNSPIGDLARDISDDKDFPKTKSKKKILEYLESKDACDGAISAFISAWEAYTADLHCDH